MKKVILAGSMNPFNKGDQARIKATIRQLAESRDIKLALLSHFFKDDKSVYSEDAIEIVKAPWSGGSVNLFRLSVMALLTFIGYLFLSFFRRILRLPVKARFFEYDCLVIASGIDFSDFAGRLPIYYSFFLVSLFGLVMGKPVMCYAQSIGPIENGGLRRLARFFLNRMRTISVRDENSLAFLHGLKINRPRVYLTVDPAFLLRPAGDKAGDILVKYGIGNVRRPMIGVSLSPQPFAGPENGYCSMGLWYKVNKENARNLSDDYIRKMTRVCDRLISLYGATLVFIPNCTAKGDDDRECIKCVYEHLSLKDRAICISGLFSLSDSMEIIGACDLFIGTRLHANILATIMGVPLIPLVGTDGPRVPGIMKMVGLDNYVRNIMTTEENQIISIISEVWNTREPMRVMIKSRVSELHEKALANVSILREFCCPNDGRPELTG